MKTRLLTVDAASPESHVIAQAAETIRSGGLAAFPTETVYGLGANAFDALAVARIFAAKGRPSTDPLIVHIARLENLAQVAAEIPPAALALAERFWPGPLTLILRRAAGVASNVAAGLDTVAVRMPAHPVALALIE